MPVSTSSGRPLPPAEESLTEVKCASLLIWIPFLHDSMILYGSRTILWADNSTQFSWIEFKMLSVFLEMKPFNSTDFHSQANGKAKWIQPDDGHQTGTLCDGALLWFRNIQKFLKGRIQPQRPQISNISKFSLILSRYTPGSRKLDPPLTYQSTQQQLNPRLCDHYDCLTSSHLRDIMHAREWMQHYNAIREAMISYWSVPPNLKSMSLLTGHWWI